MDRQITPNPSFYDRRQRPLILIGLLLLLLLISCGPPPETLDTQQTTAVPPESAVTPSPAATEHAADADTRLAGTPFDAEETETVLYALILGDRGIASEALARVAARQDQRFVPVLIELLRARQIGLITLAYRDILDALEGHTGQTFGDDWPAWIEWYGATDITPPPGFTGWKGELLSRIDPGFAEFLQDDYASTIRVEEIQWGGVVVDGIPALDQPAMRSAADADYLSDADAVFGMEINGDARAYPLLILDWHEMANDTIGGVPVSLAYCTLCGAAVAYDGRASDGVTYDFGSSGFLFRSNKLMYDRQTRTLWNQLTGQPVLGPLVGSGVQLDLLPVVLTTWGEWRTQHPDTQVVDIDTGFNRPYSAGAAYGDYFAAAETMFPVWQRSDLLATKDQIYALTLDGVPKAYPIVALTEAQVVNDRLAEQDVVLVATRGRVEVEGDSRRAGPVTYSAGAEVRAYVRSGQEFVAAEGTDALIDSQNGRWQVTESALIGPNGEELERLPGHLAYWFGWFAFFPNTLVYGE